MTATFSNGMQGSIDGAVSVRYGYDARLEVVGTEGVLFVGRLDHSGVVVCNLSSGLKAPAVESWRNLFAETNVPKIDAGEILLQVKGAFVCGTDVRMYHNGYQGISETTPMILGHEGSGVVTRCGSDVKNFKEGMRVAIAPNVGGGICNYCVSGNTHLCLDVKAVGIHLPGFFAEYVKIPENFLRQGNVVEIPDRLSFEEAALAEPLACVFNAFERSKMQPGETVLVIGAGPIGLMHAKMAQIAGVEKIIINDLSRDRLDLCRQIDSTFITLESENLKEALDTLTGGARC